MEGIFVYYRRKFVTIVNISALKWSFGTKNWAFVDRYRLVSVITMIVLTEFDRLQQKFVEIFVVGIDGSMKTMIDRIW